MVQKVNEGSKLTIRNSDKKFKEVEYSTIIHHNYFLFKALKNFLIFWFAGIAISYAMIILDLQLIKLHRNNAIFIKDFLDFSAYF